MRRYAGGASCPLSPAEGFVMLQTELYDHDVYGDAAPTVASDAEIELAERLRRQLEERYLVESAGPPPLRKRPTG